MAIDLSRAAHSGRKGYQGTRLQMGRVLSDDDFNAGHEIAEEERRHALADLIGPAGTPDGGFRVTNPQITNGRVDFTLAPGTLYLGGLRLETDGTETFQTQLDWLQQSADDRPEPPAAGERYDLVWIEAVLQDVTAVEDAELQETALGARDTSARTRVVRRVRVSADSGSAMCQEGWQSVFAELGGEPGEYPEVAGDAVLTVGYDPGGDPADLCSPAVEGGYLGPDNQAIRVQLVADGTALTWGFDNASALYRVKLGTDGDGQLRVVTLDTEPPDQAHWPTAGQVVELLPWGALLPNGQKIAERTGLLARVDGSYDPDSGALTLATPIPAGFGEAWQGRLDAKALGDPYYFLRVWDRGSDTTSPLEIPCPDGIAVPLAHTGLHVTVNGARRRPGDHWTIAARPQTPTRVVPWDLEQGRAPHGFTRWAAPVAVIRWTTNAASCTGTVVDACVPSFPPLTRRGGCCTVTVGDGVNSHGDFISIQEAVDSLPPGGGEVRLLPGEYFQRFCVENRKDVRVVGCGIRSLVREPDPENTSGAEEDGAKDASKPVVLVKDGSRVVLESFTVQARRSICVQAIATPGPLSASEGLELRDMLVEASMSSALRVTGWRQVRVRDSMFALFKLQASFVPGGAGAHPTVFIGADDVLIEGNFIGVRRPLPLLRQALGGLQIGGGSERVEIRRNVIDSGNGNGITLGSVVWVGAADFQLLSRDWYAVLARALRYPPFVVVVDDSGCLHLEPGDDDSPPPDLGDGEPAVPLSEGPVTGLRITGNRILRMGGSGIASVRRPRGTRGAHQLEDVVIDDNRIEQCLRIEVRAAHDPAAVLRTGFGGIALDRVRGLLVRDNLIAGNGSDHDHAVCGLYAAAVEGLVVRDNRIEGNGRWSRRPLPGPRDGICVPYAVPDTSDASDESASPTRPAARIERNLVSHPCGRALLLWALGPAAVSDNALAGTAIPAIQVRDEVQPVRAGTSSADEFRRWLPLADEDPAPAAARLTAALTIVGGGAVLMLGLATARNAGGASFRLHAAGLAGGLSTSLSKEGTPQPMGGPLLFSDNQVSLDSRGAQDVATTLAIITGDDLVAADNQVRTADDLESRNANSFLGWSVRVTANRFREAPGRASLSAYSLGALNTTVLNHSTHCVAAAGKVVVDHSNSSELELTSEDSCTRVRTSLDPVRLIGAILEQDDEKGDEQIDALGDELAGITGAADALRVAALLAAADADAQQAEGLAFDLARLAARDGAESPAVRAAHGWKQEITRRRYTSLTEAGRISVPLPRPVEGALVIHGRVAGEDGRGLPGLTVRARTESARSVSTTTDDVGGYALVVPEQHLPVHLAVLRGRTELYEESTPVPGQAGGTTWWEITLRNDAKQAPS
ncbi:DUF6519 domain-containing protein [Streptomyces sp. NPDC059874]|uniref:DUF6519 domain-containing protein n=1 Tax=Streptomyces sp. NPDC059874 TaxID=3346983 RepID=UPI003661A577